MDSTHQKLEAQVVEKAYNAEHNEGRRLSVSSMKKNFDYTNISMVAPDKTHLEMVDDVTADASIENIATSWFVWMVAATASIAGSLFGYDTGIISAVLVYLGTDLGGVETTSSEKELITSLCSVGAFIGAIIAGLTADKFGRKIAIYVGCVLFVAGAIIQAAAYTIAQMSVGRLIVGFGVGSAAMVVPLYIAEIAPTKVRGRLIGLNNMSITGGQVISYGIGAAFAHVPNGWRYMVGLGKHRLGYAMSMANRLSRRRPSHCPRSPTPILPGVASPTRLPRSPY